jgi:hypothetical protein
VGKWGATQRHCLAMLRTPGQCSNHFDPPARRVGKESEACVAGSVCLDSVRWCATKHGGCASGEESGTCSSGQSLCPMASLLVPFFAVSVVNVCLFFPLAPPCVHPVHCDPAAWRCTTRAAAASRTGGGRDVDVERAGIGTRRGSEAAEVPVTGGRGRSRSRGAVLSGRVCGAEDR